MCSYINLYDNDKGGLCEEHEFQCRNTECIRKVRIGKNLSYVVP